MERACVINHVELGVLKCLHTLIHGEYDKVLEYVQVRYTDSMEMVILMMSSKGKPPWILRRQDELLAMIGGFTETTVSNS